MRQPISDDHRDRHFFYAQISESEGGEPMPNNTIYPRTQTGYPLLAIRIGNTTYMVSIHFKDTAKETLDDKLKRLICKDIQQIKTGPKIRS